MRRSEFLIVAAARTGSTMLALAVDKHPQALCVVEPFNHKPDYRRRVHADVRGGPWVSDPMRRPAAYVDRVLFGVEPPAGVLAVGAKELYPQLSNHAEAYRRRELLRVVHLVRNPLESYVSWLQAKATDDRRGWHRLKDRATAVEHGLDFGRTWSADAAPPEPVAVAVEDLEEHLAGVLRWRAWTRSHFPDALELEYLELAGDWRTSFRRVCHWLRIDAVDLEQPTIKTGAADLRERIANFDQVRAALPECWRSSLGI